ncbi:hypothetical protein GGH96_003059 [Coemansia sp. RSA 1972]|nr:hypothetical protein GGH96_003059 [Coemansia sp. RSA 1972]
MDDSSRTPSRTPSQSKQMVSQKPSLASNSYNLHNQPLSRLGSLRTHASTNTSSKNTAFYSAHSQFTDTSTASLHTADDMPQMRAAGWNPQLEREEDENLVHSMARQYVLDAEAMGPSTPDKSRRNTDASRGVGGDIMTTTSEDMMPVPQLPHIGTITQNTHAEPQIVGRDIDSHLVRTRSMSEATDEKRALSERLRDEEVEDDAYEANHFVSTRKQYPPPKYSVHADASIPVGAILFVCGFLILPLWWIGAVLPRTAHDDVRTWRKYNALMSLLSLPLLGLILALGGWHATH